ncbi:MAG: hypothetical protein ACK5QI_01435 [Alphaproteobacteria bacterium]
MLALDAVSHGLGFAYDVVKAALPFFATSSNRLRSPRPDHGGGHECYD